MPHAAGHGSCGAGAGAFVGGGPAPLVRSIIDDDDSLQARPAAGPLRRGPGGPRQVDYWSWSSVLLASGRDRDIAIGHARPWFGSIGCSAPYTALPCSGPRRTSAYVFEPAYGYICTCVLCT
jgi:hypothetical protein